VPGIIEQRSFSRFGLSLVTIVFDDATDVYWARQQVTERLAQITIPESLGKPELGPGSSGLGEIFQYVVKPKPGYEGKYDASELRTIQDWIVRRQLIGTEGVADVSSFGGKLKQYEIAVDPERLGSHGHHHRGCVRCRGKQQRQHRRGVHRNRAIDALHPHRGPASPTWRPSAPSR
jgi:cobalt-zinc-cadmium resistance protein CzcA